MEENSLTKKTFKTIAWTGSVQILSQVLKFGLGIILARMLSPQDFGLLALVLVFVSFSQLLSDFGLSSALIQKSEVNKEESFTCFCFNILLGLLFALILIGASEAIANFYNEERLNQLIVVIAPIFLVNAASSVPRALLLKELQHKSVSLITLIAELTGATTAIILAYHEFGIWSLIAQQYTSALIVSTVLQIKAKLPITRVNYRSLKKFIGFSSNVFLTQLLQQLSSQADRVIIGKYVSAVQLGFYTRAFDLTAFPIKNISTVISSVMFPTLSKIQNEKERIAKIYVRATGIISVVTFPIMGGIGLLAAPIISLLLGEKWLLMEPYLIFFSVIGTIISVATITGSFYLALDKAKLQLKINTFTQPLQIVLLIVGVQFGMNGLLIAYATSKIIAALTTWITIASVLNINVTTIIYQLLKPAISVLVMVFSLRVALNYFSFESDFSEILFSVIFGAPVYLVINVIMRNKSVFELFNMVTPKLKLKSGF